MSGSWFAEFRQRRRRLRAGPGLPPSGPGPDLPYDLDPEILLQLARALINQTRRRARSRSGKPDSLGLAELGPKEVVVLATAVLEQALRIPDPGMLDTHIEPYLAAVAAIDLLERCANIAGRAHSDRPVILSSLAIALGTRFEHTKRTKDLDRAITLGEKAVGAAAPDDPHRATVLSNVAHALVTRFERTGHDEDLERAVELGEQAITHLAAKSPDRAAVLSNVASALVHRFDRTGRAEDQDRAIELR